MKVISTGHSRTGTTSIWTLFRELGISSYHQKIVAKPMASRPYDLDDPPKWAIDFADSVIQSIKNKDSEGFEVSWEYSYYIYLLSRELPDAVFLIMLRDPMLVCNSLKRYAFSGFETIDIFQLARHYNELYLFVIEQLQRMDDKPYWMDFGKYIKGKYIRQLFGLFDLELNDENLKIAEEVLSKKIRTSGHYVIMNPAKYSDHFVQKDESIFTEGETINRIIKGMAFEL